MEEGFLLWKNAQDQIKEVFDPESRKVLREAFGKVEEVEALIKE